MEPKQIIEAAIEKLNTIDAGELANAVPDLTGILAACTVVDDLTTNGFGLAIIELSKSIIGQE